MIRLMGIIGMTNIAPIKEDHPGDGVEQDDNFETTGPEADIGQVLKSQLMTANKQTGELYNMIGENEALDDWVIDKIKMATAFINDVYNFVYYDKHKPNSIGNGEGNPADGMPRESVGPLKLKNYLPKMD